MTNNIIEGEPLTILFHVDDSKEIHKDKNVIDSFEQWVDFIYGYPNIGKVKSIRGNSVDICP